MKKIAFTLAETLIVMGIIGVVAALTLPNLNSSTGDKEKVAKVKKIYQNLNDTLGRAKAIYGPIDEWTSSNFPERFIEFLKISKECELRDEDKSCFNYSNVKNLSGQVNNSFDKDTDYAYVLNDGTSLYLKEQTKLFDIVIDIDGANKGANTFGKDIFIFVIYNNEIYPYGGSPSQTFSLASLKTGMHATTWIINNENMDYLKCPNELSETKITCK